MMSIYNIYVHRRMLPYPKTLTVDTPSLWRATPLNQVLSNYLIINFI